MQTLELDQADIKSLLRRALAGDSFVLDRYGYSLHELTQLAAALQPTAALTIRHADLMSPIECASISTVSRGRIQFD
jgi:hypothetical protein